MTNTDAGAESNLIEMGRAISDGQVGQKFERRFDGGMGIHASRIETLKQNLCAMSPGMERSARLIRGASRITGEIAYQADTSTNRIPDLLITFKVNLDDQITPDRHNRRFSYGQAKNLSHVGNAVIWMI